MIERATYSVRAANDSDIDCIAAWLHAQREVDSMAANWAITLHVYRTKGMLVLEDISSAGPIAYFWGDLAGLDSVLEVRHDRRRQGIGGWFVAYLIEQARERGDQQLSVECAPASSQHFWRSMGFYVEREGRRWVGRRILL